jgi:hypothetical protein
VPKNNHKKYNKLRNDFKYFIFESFHTELTADRIEIKFHFNLADRYHFHPQISISEEFVVRNRVALEKLDVLVFHIGLIELISYWKCACPPNVIIKTGNLSIEQINWWKKLYFFGLGEFFYLNGIKADQEDFMDIINDTERTFNAIKIDTDSDKVLVPVGGGKDSAVTLELLKNNFDSVPFIINPREASRLTVVNAGFAEKDIFKVNRKIDPVLLKLNDEGFLNGHTPFSALLAFVGLYAAALTGCRHMALSNESSANEPTTAEGINHQYSKTYEFEKDFREYVLKYITRDLNYFSFLRPLDEYTIARLFSKYPNHFYSFRSCNAGSKADEWCGKCPKCLFTYIILSPHIERNILVKIFGQDLFENLELLGTFKELTGMSSIKPFECVGTVDEINLAIQNTIAKYCDELPDLLQYYADNTELGRDLRLKHSSVGEVDLSRHFLEPSFLNILKSATNA